MRGEEVARGKSARLPPRPSVRLYKDHAHTLLVPRTSHSRPPPSHPLSPLDLPSDPNAAAMSTSLFCRAALTAAAPSARGGSVRRLPGRRPAGSGFRGVVFTTLSMVSCSARLFLRSSLWILCRMHACSCCMHLIAGPLEGGRCRWSGPMISVDFIVFCQPF